MSANPKLSSATGGINSVIDGNITSASSLNWHLLTERTALGSLGYEHLQEIVPVVCQKHVDANISHENMHELACVSGITVAYRVGADCIRLATSSRTSSPGVSFFLTAWITHAK